jgi:C_GCAxxG_C_C family probable redox protein
MSIPMTKMEQAIYLFSEKYSCAQSVLMAFSEELGMDLTTASRTACAFGGGISHLGLTCGAVGGAFLVLGLKHGGGPEMKEVTYQAVREFVEQFKRLHGSINCTELIGYDLNDPIQLEAAREKGVFVVKCGTFVADAVRILEKMF